MAAAALLALPLPAAAHHSLAGYDSARPVTLTGEVAEFSFTQPHPYLVMTVKPPSGPAQAWKLEMDNLGELRLSGMSRDTFRPRDRITVTGSPDREGAHRLYVRRLDRPADGLAYEQVGTRPRLTSGKAP
jgi:hypothetical protein